MCSMAAVRPRDTCRGYSPVPWELPLLLGSASLDKQEHSRVERRVYWGWKWRVLKNRTKSCQSPAHWKEKLVLGSPPHHWLRNLSTSWHAGLWDVCRTKEALALARGHPGS